MSRAGFHFSAVESSIPLQIILSVLMTADGPLTTTDIYEISKAAGRPLSAAAIGSNIAAIRHNSGYVVSPATKFPGQTENRYWLIAAPGWTPNWHVNQDMQIIRGGPASDTVIHRRPETAEEEAGLAGQSSCGFCGKQLPSGQAFCGEEHKAAWKKNLFSR